MKKLFFLSIIVLAGCVTQPDKITESEVIKTVEGLFEAIDVENTDPGLLDKYVTSDFVIYEAKQRMTKDEFWQFVSGGTGISSEWNLSDFRISIDENSAHVSLFNTGVFVSHKDSIKLRRELKWLESAYLVRDGGTLKIKFYFSDNIAAKTDTIH